ncbi:MAG: ATP-binding protein [Bacilli bacterium]|nr:ATP-binding protein [Mycoplasmatota bacterium]MDY4237031.1 ATP-binding protein [Bacilli bacterium]
MLIREKYLSKIRGFYEETSLIKIVYGMRRSGKSVILNQIMDEIKANGVKENNIIYINFESLKYDFIKDAKDLYEYIEKLTENDDKYYVFLDEIQKVENFEKGINSLRITNNYSIFITGSNSRMTLLELSTDLSGRYVSFRINPLSFKEVVELTNTKKDKYEELLFDIFKWGSLPQRFLFKSDDDKMSYLSSVYDSIILKDIIERLGIKDVTSFSKVLQYILDTEAKEFSRDNVIEFLKKEHHEIANDTLYNYLEALTSTFIMNKVYRYDLHGKSILKTLNKYYANDLGIKQIKTTGDNINYSISLENIVYNDLIGKDYKVYIGKTKKGEIDFVATKNNITKYIQVCYKLEEESTIEREFGAFNEIEGNNKYVISLDNEDYSKNGIKHINIFDFLMNDDF